MDQTSHVGHIAGCAEGKLAVAPLAGNTQSIERDSGRFYWGGREHLGSGAVFVNMNEVAEVSLSRGRKRTENETSKNL